MKKYVHPIGQQKFYVAIYGISGAAATAAMWAEEEAYLTQMLDVSAQQSMAGKKAGLESSVQKVKDDTTTQSKAKAKTEEKMGAKAKDATTTTTTTTTTDPDDTGECPQGQTCTPAQSGSAAGAGQSDTDY